MRKFEYLPYFAVVRIDIDISRMTFELNLQELIFFFEFFQTNELKLTTLFQPASF